MAKVATERYAVLPFAVRETGLKAENNMVSESVFSLANEYSGVRGYAEEGYSGPTLLGSYFNGIYEYALKDTPIHYKGIVQRTHFMVNSIDWLYCRISESGETLDTAVSRISGFERVLDMKEGTLRRRFIWHTKSGKQIMLSFLRFLNMTDVRAAFQQISFEADSGAEISLETGLNGNLLHWRDHCYFDEDYQKAGETLELIIKTPTTGQKVASFAAVKISGAEVLTRTQKESPRFCGYAYTVKLKAGAPCVMEKFIVNIAQKQPAQNSKVLAEGRDAALKLRERGLTAALDDSRKYWGDFWRRSDIEIIGDEKNQQGIRFCLFQLQQTYHGADPSNNIGAKGLTGEAYSGHAFWDTETYCLPYYLLNNPAAARNLLMYRYKTLPMAKKRAVELDCEGACYPIATLNGYEACNLWQHASLQFQPSTAVAYGIWHYMKLHGDAEFFEGCGFEMLFEICRFLRSRGQWNADGTKFGFYAVMGPDEFQMMVNHNCYTNIMAKYTFEYFLKAAKENPALTRKLNVSESELSAFAHCAEKTYLPRSKDGVLYEQHEGFFDLPHIDVDAIPPEQFPLYNNWSYDRIYRNDMIKQPDVLMFMFLYNRRFTHTEKLANYEFYEPKTIHESSLSPSIHSVFAAELGKSGEALDFFGFATRMDLDDFNRNTSEGLHTTSIAAAWVNIVYGFGGLRTDGEKIVLNPTIPAIWKKYSFKFMLEGRIIKAEVAPGQLTLTAQGGGATGLQIFGKDYILKDSLTVEI